MQKLITYIQTFVTDYPLTPRDRGPLARCLYAHMTAAGME